MNETRRRSESRRDEILLAAVRAFAKKGYNSCRVSDIAAEAGVSHGLVYHYFTSKDEVLETIFRDNWGVVTQAIQEISETGDTAAEQLRKITAVTLHAWLRGPDFVRVIVREVSRSPQLQEQIGQFEDAFAALGHVIRHGQETGELDASLDPRVATYAVWGILDEILTGWVLGRLPDSHEDVERAVVTASTMIRRALVAD